MNEETITLNADEIVEVFLMFKRFETQLNFEQSKILERLRKYLYLHNSIEEIEKLENLHFSQKSEN